MRKAAALAAGSAVAIVLAGGLSGCGALRSERCLPAPLTASPATVAPGGTMTVSSPAVDCDLGYGSGRTHTIGIVSEVPATGGGSAFREGEQFRVGADGAFVREVVVTDGLTAGPASIGVRGSAIDDCDDGEASCAAYQVGITVGGTPVTPAGDRTRMDAMPDTEIPTTTFPDGRTAVALAQGTWNMGDDRAARSTELDALRAGLDAGLAAIDTAEMYGSGRSEELVGEAISGRREEVFLISKVLPSNASRRGTGEAARRSLARLGTDRLDLYLLHWRGSHPLADTVAAMQELVEEGLIRAWGVSNLDARALDEVAALPGGDAVQTDQVLYNLAQRGPETDVIPWSRDRRMPVMAYSPLDQGRLATDPTLAALAEPLGVSAGQLALAWVVRQAPHVFATAKAATAAHVAENRAALDLVIPDETLAELDRAFPAPAGAGPLAMY